MPDFNIDIHVTIEFVASKFQESSHYNIADIDESKYVGFVSRANVFSAYTKLVKDFYQE
jgi:chloride channel protein, CIC family